MATMYDSTSAADLPADTMLALGYVDMNYRADFDEVQARFPNATVVSVTASTTGLPGARVYDCERGDGDAQQAATWAKSELGGIYRPCIYSSRIGAPGYGWPDVQHACSDLGILGQVDFGVADYTGVKHLLAGTVFTQWANPTYTHANYDISETDGIWPGQAPVPPSKEENETVVYWTAEGQNHLAAVVGNQSFHWWQAVGGNPAGQPAWYCNVLPLAATNPS